MQSYLVNQIAAVLVEFRDGGEPIIPVTGSASWSLRDHSGALVVAYTDVPLTLGATDTQVTIQVPALQNAITSPRLFEKRTVVVKCTFAGKPLVFAVPYRIIPWLNFTVNSDDARALAGFTKNEAPDSSIDLYAAYQWLNSKLGGTALTDALSSGTNDEIIANTAIAAKGMLDALPAAATRMLKRKTDGSIEAERFDFNIESIRASLQDLVDRAVVDLSNEEAESAIEFSFSEPEDVITGA